MVKNGYIINLHLLEKCNYHCKHCFARFDSRKLLSVQDWKRIIDNIMVDSNGWLVDNSNENYQLAANLLQDDFAKGFDTLHLDEKLYKSRYNL